MTEQSKPSAPRGLGPRGRKLWRAIIRDADEQDISLDSRELVWLEEAGRLADRIDQLEAALADAPLIVPGHAKQPTAHPLLAEVRQTRALLAQTLARIRVDAPMETKSTTPGVNQHRAAVNRRWRGA